MQVPNCLNLFIAGYSCCVRGPSHFCASDQAGRRSIQHIVFFLRICICSACPLHIRQEFPWTTWIA